ncbi:unnamed protein product [Meloidogyne enterolobii]|uniref:Uncharacterized protein n=1 Tax=Meloidogyne enterolobii TaxID=390850 RepID=A0ACB1A5V0_MELEN
MGAAKWAASKRGVPVAVTGRPKQITYNFVLWRQKMRITMSEKNYLWTHKLSYGTNKDLFGGI